MQKMIAVAFSILILFQSLDLGAEDFAKFNVLLEHAEYHENTYGDSFFEFVVKHYTSNQYKQTTAHKEHQNLPFKHKTKSCSHTHVAFIYKTPHFILKPQSVIDMPFNFFYTDSASCFDKPSVFQPPKLA